MSRYGFGGTSNIRDCFYNLKMYDNLSNNDLSSYVNFISSHFNSSSLFYKNAQVFIDQIKKYENELNDNTFNNVLKNICCTTYMHKFLVYNNHKLEDFYACDFLTKMFSLKINIIIEIFNCLNMKNKITYYLIKKTYYSIICNILTTDLIVSLAQTFGIIDLFKKSNIRNEFIWKKTDSLYKPIDKIIDIIQNNNIVETEINNSQSEISILGQTILSSINSKLCEKNKISEEELKDYLHFLNIYTHKCYNLLNINDDNKLLSFIQNNCDLDALYGGILLHRKNNCIKTIITKYCFYLCNLFSSYYIPEHKPSPIQTLILPPEIINCDDINNQSKLIFIEV